MYFDNINDLQELKRKYKKLALKHHPDLFATRSVAEKLQAEEVMKAINVEYDEVFKRLQNGFFTGDSTNANFVDDRFKDIINSIIALEGLEIEICGNWIWIGGDTYKHKAALKAAGFYWACKKQKWYWKPENSESRGKGKYKMEDIRMRYGSQWITKDTTANKKENSFSLNAARHQTKKAV